jgi:hypothetical protein
VPADRVIIAYDFRSISAGWFVEQNMELDISIRVLASVNHQYRFQTAHLKVLTVGDMARSSNPAVTAVFESRKGIFI